MDKTEQQNVISVKNISKKFSIPHERMNTLKGAFVNIFRKKTYESFYALKDISFEVKKGEFLGIIGRNGSGKSTLLKILAGVYVADEGKVDIHGLISPFLELGIGFNPELSGRDNVYLNATVLGLTRKEIDKKFDSIVAFSELKRFIDQKLKNYSSGMSVRLAFSVAIHANREILLMDEVLAVGDSNFQRKCINEFEKYKKLGKTVILVTHDIQTVIEYCDRVILINNGEIIKIGEPQKVVLEYQELNMSDEDRRLRAEIKEREKQIVTENIKEVEKEEIEKTGGKEYSRETISKKVKICHCKMLNEKGKETFSVESGEKIKIKLQVEFTEDVKNIAFGVMFRNNIGKDLFGFHSLYSKNPLKIKEIKKGEKVDIIFDGEMILTQGTYSLYIGIADNVKYPNYDLLYSEESNIQIQVFSNKIFWGLINSSHITKLIKSN
jgi:ABC-2 type transport system ATP-binding protein